jgi:2-polyprenyl-3-methyl-5-hydroxy-6-metoxy-1,4-benzoquinol methylase
MTLVDEQKYPKLAYLVTEVLALWPEHNRYLEASLRGRDESLLSHSERLSEMVGRLAVTVDGGIRALASDYRFLCEEIVLPEELHFRRHDSYRLDNFEDALRTVYNDAPFMTRYMNGLLLSDVLWVNHCRGLQHYAEVYLNSLKFGAQLLEIGPGHGLLLNLALQNSNIGDLFAWDISQSSIEMSRHALKALGATQPVHFEMKNILDASIMEASNANLFDGIVLSEVLEHLEEPENAIRALYHLCKPNGRVWINVPANSPAPDHLYLVREPKQAEDLVRSVGFEVVDTAHLPMTGVTLERAIRQKLTMTCIIVGRRPGA